MVPEFWYFDMRSYFEVITELLEKISQIDDFSINNKLIIFPHLSR